jgi:hypothetical protein
MREILMERKACDRDKVIMKCSSQLIESCGRDLCKSGLQRGDIGPMVGLQLVLRIETKDGHICIVQLGNGYNIWKEYTILHIYIYMIYIYMIYIYMI